MGWLFLFSLLISSIGLGQSDISYRLSGKELIATKEGVLLWRTQVPLVNPMLEDNHNGDHVVRAFGFSPDFYLLVFNWKSKKMFWKHSFGKLSAVGPSYNLAFDIRSSDGSVLTQVKAKGQQLYLSSGQLLWQAPHNISIHFSGLYESFLVVGVSRYQNTLPFVAYDLTKGTVVDRGQAKPANLISSGYTFHIGTNYALIAEGQTLKRYDFAKGLIRQTQLSFRPNELQATNGFFFAYRRSDYMDFVEPDIGFENLALLDPDLKTLWQVSEDSMSTGTFVVNQNVVAQDTGGGNPIREWIKGRDKQSGKELWNFVGGTVKSLPGYLILHGDSFPFGDTEQLRLARKPVFVIVTTRTGNYRKISFEIATRPNCGIVDFPKIEGGISPALSYNADHTHIYITREDQCGRFISSFPWR